jgi:hypothetical protein
MIALLVETDQNDSFRIDRPLSGDTCRNVVSGEAEARSCTNPADLPSAVIRICLGHACGDAGIVLEAAAAPSGH